MAAQAAAIGEAALLAAGGWVALAELGEEDRPAVVLVREVVQVVAREALEVGAGVAVMAVMAKEAQPSGRRRAWQRRSD
jgi:hypothetical protein